MNDAPTDTPLQPLARRIQRLLRAEGHHDARVRSIDVLSGGHSGISHVAEVDGIRDHRRVVVRSAPEGRTPRGRNDVVRQARVMRLLDADGTVPVPTILAMTDTAPPLFVAEFVTGNASDPILDPPLPGETPERIGATWRSAVQLLADLHSLPLDRLGITDRPRSPADELVTWEKTMAAARLELPGVEQVSTAIRAQVPDPGPAALVHGDFRLGNILVRDARPAALIDWEIWSVTHPLIDLGWLVQFTDPATYPGIGREVPGTPSTDDVVSQYFDSTGLPEQDLHWYLALGSYKLAAIQAHNRRRHLDGVYHDPFQESLLPSIERLLDTTRSELDLARRS